MNMQLFGLDGAPGTQPDMSGFVDNYMRQRSTGARLDPRAVMHYFRPEQLPVMSRLARAFGVSDRWHASAPCETWPNRYFAHAGTAGGYVNNERSRFPYRWPRLMPTVFRRLDARGHDWRVYFHDLPQAATLVDLWPKLPTRFCLFPAEFARHARAGRLAAYSFIEPRYYPSRILGRAPNDQHPPHHMSDGEALIAAVYNAVRSAPTWEKTLLIVTYDEHGGCYDHVPPPQAVPPGGACRDGFRFDRYGVRVPALIVSPYVAPGSILRPRATPAGAPALPFDHCSIAATLHRLFDLGPPMTPRVAAAPDLVGALSLEQPHNGGPEQVDIAPRVASASELRRYNRVRNRHQRHLRSLPLLLPAAAAAAVAWVRGTGAALLTRSEARRRRG